MAMLMQIRSGKVGFAPIKIQRKNIGIYLW